MLERIALQGLHDDHLHAGEHVAIRECGSERHGLALELVPGEEMMCLHAVFAMSYELDMHWNRRPIDRQDKAREE